MMFSRRDRLQIKTPQQIELMRAAGLVVGEALGLLRAAVSPGCTTHDLDMVAERLNSARAVGAVRAEDPGAL